MNNNKRTTLLVAVLTCLAGILIELNTNQARATQLQFSFTDPVGDGDAAVDLVKMDMKIDTATGAFQIDLYADQSKPFFGGFRINVNLYNPDAHSTDPTAQLFNDDLNDFTLTQAETKLTLSGQDVRLVPWAAGDRVAASGPFPLGLPSACLCTAFGSGVLDWPITDFFRQDRIGEGEYTTIALASQPLSLSCPPTTSFKSCNPKAIIPLVYSAIPATISLAQLQAEGGDASASCGIASITYQDSTSGSCPHLLVTRMFTLTVVVR